MGENEPPGSPVTTLHMPLQPSLISSMEINWSCPTKSLSSVRNSMQWHSCKDRQANFSLAYGLHCLSTPFMGLKEKILMSRLKSP